MMRLLRTAICVIGMTGLVASSAWAGAMYTVKDVGTVDDPQVGIFNSIGERFLRIDASGTVTRPLAESDLASYTGPIPAGMRYRDGYYPHASTDGQYLVGTAYATNRPQAWWAGYVVHGGAAKPIGTLGDPASTYSQALGVNNSGTVVGASSADSGTSHAIVVDAVGRMTDLGRLGNGYNAALAINNKGTIVGAGANVFGASDVFRAFISDGHALTDLNTLIAPVAGFSLISATAINDSGQIAAYGRFASDPNWLIHEILLSPTSLDIPPLTPSPAPVTDPAPTGNPQPSPIPEPTTLALFALIAGAVGLRARRRRVSAHL